MLIFKRIIAALSVPMALFMLLTGASFLTKEKQQRLEKETEEAIEKEFVPVFRFAITSDIHINAGNDDSAKRLVKLFETAYRYSDSHPSYNTLDAVLFAGDNADSGSEEEYDILLGVVNENKRDETQLVTVMGNHEFAQTGHEGYVRRMGEELDKHVVIKGFHIIGISPTPTDTWHSPKQMFWIDKQLKEAQKDDPNKPIFTMQHGHIFNTVYVSRSWFTQMSLPLHAVLSKYHQVINFSGHSHGPINNPLDIWQNSYTQLGTGTLKYFEMERDIGDNTIPAGSQNAAQYLMVEVDAENRVRVQPFNILTEDFFRTPSQTDDPNKQLIWQINDVNDVSGYVYTSARKKTATLPYFDSDAAIEASEITDGKATVTFDQAKDDICVYGYRIRVANAARPNKKVFEKEIYSEYYFEPMPEKLSCVLEGLEDGQKYTVTVTPLNVWKQKGEPLTLTFGEQ